MPYLHSRRNVLAGLSALGATGFWANTSLAAAEPPPEVTTLRLPAIPAACQAPLYLAEELLHQEGFTEVRYVPTPIISVGMVADGDLDLSGEAGVDYLPLVDAGRPLTVLAGVQVGCMELRANEQIRSVADLQGKRVGISAIGAADHLLVGAMASYVGLDPTAVNWVANTSGSQAELFIAGEVDAFIGVPPDPGRPCARNLGHVVVNIAHDRPWSDYFCCMTVANADFVRSNPVATKRALRAILKAADLCYQRPELVAQRMAALGFSHECALNTLNDAKYGLWRDYDPEDSVRFYALRLNEVGMIKKVPNEIVSQFTDWRFLNELRRELKM